MWNIYFYSLCLYAYNVLKKIIKKSQRLGVHAQLRQRVRLVRTPSFFRNKELHYQFRMHKFHIACTSAESDHKTLISKKFLYVNLILYSERYRNKKIHVPCPYSRGISQACKITSIKVLAPASYEDQFLQQSCALKPPQNFKK